MQTTQQQTCKPSECSKHGGQVIANLKTCAECREIALAALAAVEATAAYQARRALAMIDNQTEIEKLQARIPGALNV